MKIRQTTLEDSVGLAQVQVESYRKAYAVIFPQVNNPQAVSFWQKYGYRIVSGPTLVPDQTTVFGLRKDIDRQ